MLIKGVFIFYVRFLIFNYIGTYYKYNKANVKRDYSEWQELRQMGAHSIALWMVKHEPDV